MTNSGVLWSASELVGVDSRHSGGTPTLLRGSTRLYVHLDPDFAQQSGNVLAKGTGSRSAYPRFENVPACRLALPPPDRKRQESKMNAQLRVARHGTERTASSPPLAGMHHSTQQRQSIRPSVPSTRLRQPWHQQPSTVLVRALKDLVRAFRSV